jgi:hypothetical protein
VRRRCGRVRGHLQAAVPGWLKDLVSDVKRLENELRTLWMAVQQDVEEEHPKKTRAERRQLARSRFTQLVDDVVREIASE